MKTHLLEPKGELTLQLVNDLNTAVAEEAWIGGAVVVTLRSITGVRWSALCEFAAAFQRGRTRCDLRVCDVAPRLRALFSEVGIP
jgi:anti-anti-sigma regulatory factor